jgi:hypothetical protein
MYPPEPGLAVRGKPEEPHWCIEVLGCSTIAKNQRNHLNAVIEGSLESKDMLLPTGDIWEWESVRELIMRAPKKSKTELS